MNWDTNMAAFIVLGHQYGRCDVMWKQSIRNPWQSKGKGGGGSLKGHSQLMHMRMPQDAREKKAYPGGVL